MIQLRRRLEGTFLFRVLLRFPVLEALSIVLFATAVLMGAVVAFGFIISAPARAVIGAAPPELNVESITMSSNSGATLRGWFVAGQPGRGAVVLMHGVRSNRLSMIRRARLLSAEGLSVLLFDFQAHGESTGDRVTFGHLESLDAEAAVESPTR